MFQLCAWPENQTEMSPYSLTSAVRPGSPCPAHPKHTNTPRGDEPFLLLSQAREVCFRSLCGRQCLYGLFVTRYPEQIKYIPSAGPQAAECIQSSHRVREEERACTDGT